jgi:HEPN domain-containing protein
MILTNPFSRLSEEALEDVVRRLVSGLKGLLLFNEQRPPRTHSLIDLFGLCERWRPGLAAYEEDCEWPTGFAVELRYQGHEGEITREMASKGLAAVESAIRFVVSKLPREVAS